MRRLAICIVAILFLFVCGCSGSSRLVGKWTGRDGKDTYSMDFLPSGILIWENDLKDLEIHGRQQLSWEVVDSKHLRLVDRKDGKEIFLEYEVSGNQLRVGKGTVVYVRD